MEEITMGVNWLAVIIGAVLAFALGMLWYSPKMFGTKWAQGVGLDTTDKKGPMTHAMIAQAIGTLLFAWVIGVTAAADHLLMAVLVTLTIAVLIKANGYWSGKSTYAIKTEVGYIVAMAVVMIVVHGIL